MLNFKKRFTKTLNDDNSTIENIDDLLKQNINNKFEEGSVVSGKIIGQSKDLFIVDVGAKNECRIPVSEFKITQDYKLPEIGEFVDVFIEKKEDRRAGMILSREKALGEESWSMLEKKHKDNETVDGVILGKVKGGYTVKVSGVIAFLPGSQVDIRHVKDIDPLIGLTQPFVILKMDKEMGNIVVSRRAVLEESRIEARDEMLSGIKEGDVLDGVVKNITDYGAFIDLGNIDGLLHVTDISWGRINHPSEALTIGQNIKVMVIKFDQDSKRISLGMKQMDDSLWQSIESDYKTGEVYKGKVTNITDYGAFVELHEGVEGLVHSSEISWTKTNQSPKKLLTIGQEVNFKILDIDTPKHRVSLSIKQCVENPWESFLQTNAVGDVIKAEVINVADYGVFLKINENLDGFIHVSDLSWDGSKKEYSKGDMIECKVLAVDQDKARVNLGIKQLTPDTLGEKLADIKKGEIVTSVVSSTSNEGIKVSINGAIEVNISKNELSADKLDQRPDRFAAGDKVDAKVVSFDKKSRKLVLSIKALELDERAKAIKEYGSADAGARLGDILGASLASNNTSKESEKNSKSEKGDKKTSKETKETKKTDEKKVKTVKEDDEKKPLKENKKEQGGEISKASDTKAKDARKEEKNTKKTSAKKASTAEKKDK